MFDIFYKFFIFHQPDRKNLTFDLSGIKCSKHSFNIYMKEYVHAGVSTGLGPCPGKFSVSGSRIPFRVHGTVPDSRVPQIYDSGFRFFGPGSIQNFFFTNEEGGDEIF